MAVLTLDTKNIYYINYLWFIISLNVSNLIKHFIGFCFQMDIEIISKATNFMIMFLQYKYNTAGLTMMSATHKMFIQKLYMD